MRWISVKKRLPKNAIPVIIYDGYKVGTATYLRKKGYCKEGEPFWYSFDALCIVLTPLFWMNLPKLPSGKERGKK